MRCATIGLTTSSQFSFQWKYFKPKLRYSPHIKQRQIIMSKTPCVSISLLVNRFLLRLSRLSIYVLCVQHFSFELQTRHQFLFRSKLVIGGQTGTRFRIKCNRTAMVMTLHQIVSMITFLWLEQISWRKRRMTTLDCQKSEGRNLIAHLAVWKLLRMKRVQLRRRFCLVSIDIYIGQINRYGNKSISTSEDDRTNDNVGKK